MKVGIRNGNVESALRVLKRKTKDSLIDIRSKEHYEKPSAKRNRMKQAAKVREQKRQRDENKKRTKSY